MAETETRLGAAPWKQEEHRRSALRFALLGCLQAGLCFLLLVQVIGLDPMHSDLMTFYASGKLLIDSPSQLYDLDRQAEMQSAVSGEPVDGSARGFRPLGYPPVSVLVYSILTLVAYPTAFWIVFGMNFALLGATLYAFYTRIGARKGAWVFIGTCVAFAAPTHMTLLQGQFSFAVLLMLTLVVVNLDRGRDGQAGLWAGLLALKPVLLPQLILWLAVRCRWRAVRTALAVGGVLAIVSVMLVGWEGARGYIEIASSLSGGTISTAPIVERPTLRGLLGYFELRPLVWGLSSAAIFLLLFRSKQRGRWDSAAALLAAMLTAPYLNLQDISPVFLVIAILASRAKLTRPQTWIIFVAVVSMGWSELFTAFPLAPVWMLVGFVFFQRTRPIESGFSGKTSDSGRISSQEEHSSRSPEPIASEAGH